MLRKNWGYEGVIISDWSACRSTEKSCNAGLDIEMSVALDFDQYYFGDNLYNMVNKGKIDEAVIDEKVLRILKLMNKLNMLDGKRKKGRRNTHEHQLSILKAAEESIVLLENKDDILPLNCDEIKSIAIIGENAVRTHSDGGGSAEIKALYEHTPLAGISMYLGGNMKVTYSKGYTSDKDADKHTYFDLREQAVRIASAHDVVIFIGGLNHDYDTEGKDREDIKLPYEQDKLIKSLSKANPNLIAINLSGSAVDLSTAADYSKALVQTWYNGMEGGRALAHVLFGEVNPSGKLPFTFANRLCDYAAHSVGEFPGGTDVNYKDSIYVGYRHFDTNNIETLYPFGYGLSYTTFDYSNLEIKKQEQEIIISLDIFNVGEHEGKEIVQLYIHDKISSEQRPYKELKGFKKVNLLPNEKKAVEFVLCKDDFSYYSEAKQSWIMENGEFVIMVGASCDDIRIQQTIEL